LFRRGEFKKNIFIFRRGSPLLIGIKAGQKFATDHIPIFYRSDDVSTYHYFATGSGWHVL
jgi:glucosamine 6-phosphate synthetase-like amidotransferase/phosphosugar isomerase protein